MKTLSLALGAAVAALSAGPAMSNVFITTSESAAEDCFRSAKAMTSSVGAISQCTSALQNDDRMAPADRVATLVNRGILLMLADRSVEASRDFDEALAIDSKEPEAYLNKGMNLFRVGNSSEAYALANRAIELRTRRPAMAYYVRGLANEERGDVRAAYADLNRARQLEPHWQDPARQLERYHIGR